VLAPGTVWGREVAGRVAARLGLGLIGDAVELEWSGDRLVAWKPAFGGTLVAAITSSSAVQMATVRPGVVPPAVPREGRAPVTHLAAPRRSHVQPTGRGRDDDVEHLARARTVIGVGAAIPPDRYPVFDGLRRVLAAELAATRRVTDQGWMPRARQVGITGRSIAPRLYVALAISGKFNHMAGVRRAETILAVNTDRQAPVFGYCDVGIVGDWAETVALLEAAADRFVAPRRAVSA